MAGRMHKGGIVNQIHVADSRVIGQLLAPLAGYVQAVITSPPYWNMKDYGVPGQIGYGQKREQFLADVTSVFQGCYDLTADRGSLWVVVGDFWFKTEQQLLPFEVARAAQAAGWVLRDTVIWSKSHDVPWHNSGRFRNTTEFVFVFSKKRGAFTFFVDRLKTTDTLSRWWVDFPERFNPKGSTPTNVWSIPLRTQGMWRKPSDVDHHCPFPIELVRRMIEVSTNPGDVVLDPFAGSGMVLGVAEQMGRTYVGVELNPVFVGMFEEVVRREVKGEWAELSASLQQRGAIPDFEQLILKLRALKYGREVARIIQKHAAAGRVHCVVVDAEIPASHDRGIPTRVQLDVVVEHNIIDTELETIMASMNEPPLSYYGIEASLTLLDKAAVSRKRSHKFTTELNVYPGKIRRPEGRQSVKSFVASPLVRARTIPVLSSVDVSVPPAFQ